MYGYIYLIQNKINGKGYIGQHKYAGPGFDDKYWGSGVLINEAYKKYGKENFSRHIICTCESKEELDEKEKYGIKELDALNPDKWYNLSPGGNASGSSNPIVREKIRKALTGVPHTEERRQNQSKARKKRYAEGGTNGIAGLTKETDERVAKLAEKMSISKLGSTPGNAGISGYHIHSEEHKQEMREKTTKFNEENGNPFTWESSRKKMSEKAKARKGTHYWTNGEKVVRTAECLEGYWKYTYKKKET